MEVNKTRQDKTKLRTSSPRRNTNKTTTEGESKGASKQTRQTDSRRQISKPQAGKARGTEECACRDFRACALIALSIRPVPWINNIRFAGFQGTITPARYENCLARV